MSLKERFAGDYWSRWIKAALIRAAKTFAQTAVSMITIGAMASEINWIGVGSVAFVAAVCSLLTSVAGLPEVPEQTEEQ